MMDLSARPSAATDHQGPSDLAIVAASGVVDQAWYLAMYSDVAKAGVNPLIHYVRQGWHEGRDPGPTFSVSYYLSENPDVAAYGVNPLVHYLTEGWREGRLPRPDFEPRELAARFPDVCPLVASLALPHDGTAQTSEPETGAELPELVARAGRAATEPPGATPLRTVAFYLPQFHPIPENDEWWGEGFTEWRNVRRGVPRFQDHHQPHVPGELGHYDLRDPGVQRRQVELAQLHGVTAFCFYAYWFGGERLLEGPLDAFVADPSLDLEFMVCWANENWSRTWDGADHEILIGQQHSPEDDLAFIAEMSHYLRDPRYTRVDGKPVLLVYRPSLLPEPAVTADRWRTWCRENGIGEIVLAYVQSFDLMDPRDIGFDVAVEFPPNNTAPDPVTHLEPTDEYSGKVYDWVSLALRSENYTEPLYPTWRGTCPSWDNEARRPGGGALLWGSNPAGFRRWLVNAGRETVARLENPEERFVFINAWNEWAEGAHLEPDEQFGYQWLHAVRDAQDTVAGLAIDGSGPGVVVVAHDLHPHGAQMLALSFVRTLRRLGRRVEVVALGEGELLERFEALAPTHRLGLVGDDGEQACELATDLVRRGFTTALSNSSVSGFFGRAMADAGAHVTGLVHEMPQVLAEERVAVRAKALADSCDRLIFPAAVVAESYPYTPRGGCEVVIRPQGLYQPIRRRPTEQDRSDLRRSLGIELDARVVLGVGFGDHRKGLDLFIAAANQAVEDAHGRPIHYVWIGKLDTYDARIADSITSAGSARLHLPGFIADPSPYYLGADVIGLPSREDPFPSVVLEGMSVGLPVVAFRGRTGQDHLLVEGDCVLVEDLSARAFAGGVITALDARSTAAGDARAALIAERFNFQRYVLDLLAATPARIPRVSVVVPNYRYEKFVAERLAQVLGQSHPVYEVIVLDDASPDGSVAAIRAALENVEASSRLVVNEINSGSVFRQWALGADLARGDLIWIAEADDVAKPDFLKTLVPSFRDPEVVLAYSQSRQVGSSGEELAPDYHDYVRDVTARDWTRRYIADGPDEIAQCLAVKNTIPNVSAVVFDAATLREVLSREPSLGERFPTSGDWWVYVETLRKGRVVYEPEALNDHRRHADSVIATNLGREHLDEIMRMQAHVSEVVEVTDEVSRAAIAYDRILYQQFELGAGPDLDNDGGFSEPVDRWLTSSTASTDKESNR